MIKVDAIKDRLIELNMTVEGLAIDLDINRSTLYRKLQKGGNSITLEEMIKISKVLNLDNQKIIEIFLS